MIPFNPLIGQQFRTLEILKDSFHQQLDLRFESNSFIKNNEYNSKTTKGFTGIGFSAKPTLEYWASQGTKINAGVFLLKYSGQDEFLESIPIFSVQQKLSQDLDLVLGSIYGNLNHELEEPLYRIDNFYQNNVEYGLQLLYQKAKFKSDLWISWDEFIQRGDPFQEQWTAGAHLTFDVFKKDNWRIVIPFQSLLFHYGGEIDTSPDPVLSIYNGQLGLKAINNFKSGRNLDFSVSYYIYDALNAPDAGVHAQAYSNGQALLIASTYQVKNIKFSMAYWAAENFIAPRGEFLILSIPEFEEGSNIASRFFLNAGLSFKKEIQKNMLLEFDMRGYYDLDAQQFSHAMALYFFINDVFGSWKIKK